MSAFKTLNGYEVKDSKAREDVARHELDINALKDKETVHATAITNLETTMGDVVGDIASVKAINNKQDGEIASIMSNIHPLVRGWTQMDESLYTKTGDFITAIKVPDDSQELYLRINSAGDTNTTTRTELRLPIPLLSITYIPLCIGGVLGHIRVTFTNSNRTLTILEISNTSVGVVEVHYK